MTNQNPENFVIAMIRRNEVVTLVRRHPRKAEKMSATRNQGVQMWFCQEGRVLHILFHGLNKVDLLANFSVFY